MAIEQAWCHLVRMEGDLVWCEDGGGANMARGLHRKRCNNGYGIGGWFGSSELVFGFIDLHVLDFVILIHGFVHSWVMF